ncbi:MAG: hypothetical protein DYH05_08095 [Acidobacteria bacterium ACB1]|nr:hypothetical protein [Pyrinomonadaceae bacterium]MCE7962444.1 hypothetical protein [Acidobacteria bacterium ACB1]RIJ94038.1 MAG: hypothetical protein DCC44_05730 [Acidobacteriota bacterium]
MQVLSNVQKELLMLYSNDVSEESLLEIKALLADYFARRASDKMDEFWEEKGLTAQAMVEWADEHNRQ